MIWEKYRKIDEGVKVEFSDLGQTLKSLTRPFETNRINKNGILNQ